MREPRSAEPIAAASIAQVHTARLQSGDQVVVKVRRPDVVGVVDEPRLERALGLFLARYFAAGSTPDVRMFTDLFRIVADYGLAVPPETAAVFRVLATMEGTLTQLAPGFDIVAEAKCFGDQQLAAQLSPEAIRNTAAADLAMLLPMLRRLLRRIDRLGGALEDGRLTVSVRLLADRSDRRYLTALVHRVLLAFLAAAAGIMAVLMIGLHGGPQTEQRRQSVVLLRLLPAGDRGDPRGAGARAGVSPRSRVRRCKPVAIANA